MTSIGYPQCERLRRDKIITLKDPNGGSSKYIGQNPYEKTITQIEIDGCVIKEQSKKRCDYLILDCDSSLSYFIELKGSNLDAAYQQIISTFSELKSINGFKTNVLERNFKMLVRIVLAKGNVPSIIPSSYRKLVNIVERVNGAKVRDGLHIKRIKSGQEETF